METCFLFIVISLLCIAGATTKECLPPAPPTPYKLSVCTMVNNEANYIEEWLSYHMLIKVDHFYIYDDGSTDNTRVLLEPYIQQGYVTVIPWDKNKRTVDPAKVSIDPPYTLSQRFAIADCLFNHNHESDWFGVWDVDEFLVLNSHNNMHDFIDSIQQISDDYRIPTTIFGYAGYMDTPAGLVIENYQWRSNVTVFGMDPNTGKFSGKSMYKSGCGLPNVHFTTELPSGCRKHNGWVEVEGDSLELPITLSHFALKSWEHFAEKMQKWHFGMNKDDFDNQIEFSNTFHDDSLAKHAEKVEQVVQCMAH